MHGHALALRQTTTAPLDADAILALQYQDLLDSSSAEDEVHTGSGGQVAGGREEGGEDRRATAVERSAVQKQLEDAQGAAASAEAELQRVRDELSRAQEQIELERRSSISLAASGDESESPGLQSSALLSPAQHGVQGKQLEALTAAMASLQKTERATRMMLPTLQAHEAHGQQLEELMATIASLQKTEHERLLEGGACKRTCPPH